MSSTELEPPVRREGMPREVMAWLRTLHLPRVVRHPKRDFSNGFLVAAICSRYWSSVSMHSYEDKMSAVQKRSNWELLQKQFALNNCPLSARMIDGMIACREDYANFFLRQLYEHLTGRVIVEAAPLTAEEVAQPKTFPPPAMPPTPSRNISVEFAAPTADTLTETTSRVRELRSLNVAALATPEIPPPVPGAKKHVIYAITGEQTEDGEEEREENSGGDIDSNKRKQHEKQNMDFSVSLRPAEVQHTVVRAASKGNGKKTARDEKKQQQQQPDDFQSPTYDVSAMEIIESIVRKQAAGQGWLCVRDKPTAFTEYFLREESNLGALLQCRLWSTLLASVGELTDCILRQGGFMSDIAALFLQRPPPEEASKEREQQQRYQLQVDEGSSTPKLWRMRAFPRGNSGSRRLVFLASLLASISDAEKFLAVSIYYDDILPHSAEAMRTLDHATADEYASLLCAVLPSSRKIAARLLPDVLWATHNAITNCRNAEAKRSYYLLLRAVLLRLSRHERCGSLRSKRCSSDATATQSTPCDPLLNVAFDIVRYNVLSALSHESSTVRLLGVYLAEALAFAGCPTATLFRDILPLLAACRSFTSPLFNCVCAAWMRGAMKRFSSPFVDGAEGGGTYDKELCAYAGPHLAAIMQHLSDILLAPGPLNIKTYIAEQLALCFHDIPDTEDVRKLFGPEKVARAIFSVLQSAPSEVVATFIKPPSSAEGGVRFGGEYNGSVLVGKVSSPLLGPLVVEGSLRSCYPLALSEAILMVFPPEGGGLRLAAPREATTTPLTGVRGTNGLDGMPITSRQILAKAALMLRDRVLPVEVAQRVTWMYKIIVASRGDCGFPERPASLSEAAATKRWNAVMQQMYRDIAVLAAAAEMICTQKGALTDDVANTIAQMAGMAQQIVLRWHTELKRDGAQPSRSHSANSATSSERMMQAMEWYHKVCGVMAPKEQQQQQQQQQNRVSAALSRTSGRRV